MEQVWHDLLFAHWRVDARALAELVPSTFELDTFDGSAWVGVVPFRMTGVRVRGLPPIPGVNAFAELNLRTYVRHGGVGGVYFITLEAESPLAVRAARAFFYLPYHHARMHCKASGEDIDYASERTHRGTAPARFVARYGPRGAPYGSEKGSLEHWLTERYCLLTTDARSRVIRANIHHMPWALQAAWAEIEVNTLPEAHAIVLPNEAPLLHFARRLDVLIWAPHRVWS